MHEVASKHYQLEARSLLKCLSLLRQYLSTPTARASKMIHAQERLPCDLNKFHHMDFLGTMKEYVSGHRAVRTVSLLDSDLPSPRSKTFRRVYSILHSVSEEIGKPKLKRQHCILNDTSQLCMFSKTANILEFPCQHRTALSVSAEHNSPSLPIKTSFSPCAVVA